MASRSCVGEDGERGMLFHFSFTLFRSRFPFFTQLNFQHSFSFHDIPFALGAIPDLSTGRNLG